MVSRKKPNWVELLDGPCAGTRVIAQSDEHGCFEVEKYEGSGLSAVRKLHVYRQEPAVPRQLLRAAGWRHGRGWVSAGARSVEAGAGGPSTT